VDPEFLTLAAIIPGHPGCRFFFPSSVALWTKAEHLVGLPIRAILFLFHVFCFSAIPRILLLPRVRHPEAHFGQSQPGEEENIHEGEVRARGGTMADFAYRPPAPMANERWLSSRRCEQISKTFRPGRAHGG
jgi:hypothetical protein